MKIKQLILIFTITLFAVIMVACSPKSDKIQIGILQFAQAGALDDARLGFIEALEEKGFIDGETIEITVSNANTDFSLMNTQSKSLIRNSDLVLGIATPAAQALLNEAILQNSNIPVLFTAVTDPVAADLVTSLNEPGANVTGTTDLNPVGAQLDLIKELLPNATKVGFIYTSSEDNSIIQLNLAKTHLENSELDLELVERSITDVSELEQVARTLARSVDIIYIPTDNVISDAIETIGGVLLAEKIPAIVGEEGMISATPSLTLGINYFNLGIQTGNQAALILNGQSPSLIPVEGQTNHNFKMNEELLLEIGITIPESLKSRVD